MKIKKKDNKGILIIIIGIAIILAIMAFVTKPREKKYNFDKMSDEEIETVVKEKTDNMKIIDLSQKGERDRMEYYVATFIKDLEDGNYEEAYSVLNNEFKNNYFKSYSNFEEYAKKKFPKMISLTHDNIERNGDIYVLWVTMSDSLGSKGAGKEMNFVIKEKDLNDFELSFSVDN